MKPKRDQGAELNTLVLAVCLGFHAIADWILVGRAWILSYEQQVVAIALPLSQCSLCAVWAATSRSSPYLRFAVPLIGAVASWWMLTQLLIWGVGEPASAAWALAIAAQTIVIIVLTNLHQRIWNPGSQRYAIDLRTLILWTTAAALAFCFMQYGREQWLWTMVVTQWQFFDFVMIHGVVNALLAVLWLWAIAAGNWKYRAVKIAMAVLLVGLLSVKLASAVTWIFGPIVYADHIWLVVVVQSILLSGTIACARIGTRRLDRGKSPSKPLTEASYVCEKGVRYQ